LTPRAGRSSSTCDPSCSGPRRTLVPAR
jgi:hypothetical protein